jgi:hypothetical protein
MRGLDGSTGMNKVIRHLDLSVVPVHTRDIFTWTNLKKWRSGQIHRIFRLCYRVSIASISNHPEALLTRFRFDVYSSRYLHEQKVSDFRGSLILCKKMIFLHLCSYRPGDWISVNTDRSVNVAKGWQFEFRPITYGRMLTNADQCRPQRNCAGGRPSAVRQQYWIGNNTFLQKCPKSQSCMKEPPFEEIWHRSDRADILEWPRQNKIHIS